MDSPTTSLHLRSMNPEPSSFNRKSLRLKGFDYSSERAYLVTLCTQDFHPYLGWLEKGKMHLNPLGEMVKDEWEATTTKRKGVSLDEFIIMPDHVHGIVIISDQHSLQSYSYPNPEKEQGGNIHPSGDFFLKGPSQDLSAIIRGFKSATTSFAKACFKMYHSSLWHRGFYDHIIRNEKSLEDARRFIQGNPAGKYQETLHEMLDKVYPYKKYRKFPDL